MSSDEDSSDEPPELVAATVGDLSMASAAKNSISQLKHGQCICLLVFCCGQYEPCVILDDNPLKGNDAAAKNVRSVPVTIITGFLGYAWCAWCGWFVVCVRVYVWYPSVYMCGMCAYMCVMCEAMWVCVRVCVWLRS